MAPKPWRVNLPQTRSLAPRAHLTRPLPLPAARGRRYTSRDRRKTIETGREFVEHHGTLGTVWASLGMTAYYMALIWINILLGTFLSPLFMIPVTWLQDHMRRNKRVA